MRQNIQTFIGGGVRRFFKTRSFAEFGLFFCAALIGVGIALLVAMAVAPFDSAKIGPVENGVYELGQVFLLVIVCGLFLTAASRFRGEIFYVAAIATAFSALALVRETPRCGSPFHDGGPCFSADGKTMVGLAIAAVFVGLVLFKRVPFAKRWEELTFFYVTPVVLAGLMLVGAEVWARYQYVWFEEILEMAAYLTLLNFAAVLNARPDLFTDDAGHGTDRKRAKANEKSRLANSRG